jgi:hypothetical protein
MKRVKTNSFTGFNFDLGKNEAKVNNDNNLQIKIEKYNELDKDIHIEEQS